MPRVRHKSGGVQELGIVPGVPEHSLFGGNGEQGRDQSNGAGRGEIGIAARQNVVQAHLADAQPGDEQDQAQHQRGHALKPLVAVGVLLVGGLLGQPHPQKGDEGGEHIGQGVDRVGHHGPRTAHHSGEELKDGEDHVAQHGDHRHPLEQGARRGASVAFHNIPPR